MSLPAENLRSLPALASAINAEHEAAEKAINDSLSHARRCGELLNEAKAQCAHGEWGGWLAENFRAGETTARGYMRIARRWTELPEHNGNALPIRDALAALAEPRDPEPEPEPGPARESGADWLRRMRERQAAEAAAPAPAPVVDEPVTDIASKRPQATGLPTLSNEDYLDVLEETAKHGELTEREKGRLEVLRAEYGEAKPTTTPTELVGGARREFRESPTGRMHAYRSALPTPPDFTDADIAGIEWDPASRDILAMHRDLIDRLLTKEANRVSA